MNLLNETFNAIRLQESKPRTVILLAGVQEYEIGFATYSGHGIVLRLRRCDLIDGYIVQDVTGQCVNVNRDYDADWVKKNLGIKIEYPQNSIVGMNDTYEAGYILFHEEDPNFRFSVKLSQTDWDHIASFGSVMLYQGQDDQIVNELSVLVVSRPEIEGWKAPMEDQ